MNLSNRIVTSKDDNIGDLRTRYPNGLHFVVGDTHGECETLKALMEKIQFDPDQDHVYFVGDYNAGGNVQALLEYIAEYFQPDYSLTGFHLIRGNHERELFPLHTLENLPDIIVLKEKHLTYFIVHAGIIAPAFDLINYDISKHPEKTVFAYILDDKCVGYDAPLRQIIWSRYGLYSQRSHWQNWPTESELLDANACIIHGHSPYCFFKKDDRITYGDNSLFWQDQRIFFSEDLQSFNIDSNIKGRVVDSESHRGLSCICLEIIEEIAATNGGHLTVDCVKAAPNFVFSTDYVYNFYYPISGDISAITDSRPEYKFITLNDDGYPVIAEY